jgi:hypothetical protein
MRILSELMMRARSEYMPASAIAHVYLGLGEDGSGLEWLLKAEQQRDINLLWLKSELWGMYESLRGEPRFEELVGRVFPTGPAPKDPR